MGLAFCCGGVRGCKPMVLNFKWLRACVDRRVFQYRGWRRVLWLAVDCCALFIGVVNNAACQLLGVSPFANGDFRAGISSSPFIANASSIKDKGTYSFFANRVSPLTLHNHIKRAIMDTITKKSYARFYYFLVTNKALCRCGNF